jgi:hypothetical protein
LFSLPVKLLLFFLFFCLSSLLLGLAFQFFNFLVVVGGGLGLALDGASVAPVEEVLGIGDGVDVIVGVGAEVWDFTLLELHIE